MRGELGAVGRRAVVDDRGVQRGLRGGVGEAPPAAPAEADRRDLAVGGGQLERARRARRRAATSASSGVSRADQLHDVVAARHRVGAAAARAHAGDQVGRDGDEAVLARAGRRRRGSSRESPKISWMTITTPRLVLALGIDDPVRPDAGPPGTFTSTHSPCRGDFSRAAFASASPGGRFGSRAAPGLAAAACCGLGWRGRRGGLPVRRRAAPRTRSPTLQRGKSSFGWPWAPPEWVV